MGAWTEAELADIGRANDLLIAPERADGTLQRSRIVWVVRRGGDVYSVP